MPNKWEETRESDEDGKVQKKGENLKLRDGLLGPQLMYDMCL